MLTLWNAQYTLAHFGGEKRSLHEDNYTGITLTCDALSDKLFF